jgi:hypothetical protein
MVRSHLVVIVRDLTGERLGILRGSNPRDGACNYEDSLGELHG